MKKTARHYVDNFTFTKALVDYDKECKLLEAQNLPINKPSDYIGNCVLLICHHLSYRYNFSRYSWKQEMVADAIFTCIKAVRKFDPEKSNNAFAYLTRIAFNAFVGRINIEKRHTDTKNMVLFNIDIDDFMSNSFDSDGAPKYNEMVKYLNDMGLQHITEKNLPKARKKTIRKVPVYEGNTLDSFLDKE